MEIIYQLTLILGCSIIAVYVSKLIKIPVVVGQILIGILLSPALLNLVQHTKTIEIMAEIGVILLMFLAGLESDSQAIQKNLKPAMGIAISGVFIPILLFFLVVYLLGQSISISLFYGIVFAATSVSITVDVLQEYGYLQTKAGSTILGAAIIDDILSVLILSFFIVSSSNNGSLFATLFYDGLFFAFLLLMYRGIPWLSDILLKKMSATIFASFALVLCFSFSLLAHKLGLSTVLGAFFAGLILGQLKKSHEIEQSINALANQFFIPIFFVSISLSITFSSLFSNPLRIVLLTILAVLSKYLPSYLISRFHHFSKHEGKLIGASMVSRGEMALIVAQIGLTNHIIQQENYSELVLVIVLSTVIAPLMIKSAIKHTIS